MTHKAVSRRLESIQLMAQATFQELTQNQLITQVDSPVLTQIDSWLKRLPDFSIQINSWLKWSTFDSESTHDSTLGYRYRCLVVRDQLAMRFTLVRGWGTSACAHERTPFPYLGNDRTDCAEIWYDIRHQLAMHKLSVGFICTCVPLFQISGTAEALCWNLLCG